MTLKKIVLSLFSVIIILLISVYVFGIEQIDKTSYKDLACYQNTNSNINNLIINELATKNTFSAGWAKATITPEKPVEFAGYGLRNNFAGVYDSLFVRAIVFGDSQNNSQNNSSNQIAIISMDLLIVHPDIANAVRRKLENEIPEIKFAYFTATHTHHGIGGWAKGLVGTLSMGGYDKEIFEFIVNQTVKAVINAAKNCRPATIGYGQIWAKDFVTHRIERNSNTTDSWLRLVKIRQDTGKEAVMITYNAHNNGLRHDMPMLSNDYVGALLGNLQNKNNIDFALFASGMVASHNWNGKGDDYESVAKGGKVLSDLVVLQLPQIATKSIDKIKFATLPIEVREPQFRLNEEFKVSKWLFEAVIGKLDAYMSVLQVGDIVLVGMPCDFSGELFAEIATITAQKKQNLVITSFNGAYIGYISHDRLYGSQHSEIKDMNWVAPESSWYFTEITKKLLKKF